MSTSKLFIRFAISLETVDQLMKHHGPLFHRWLPDGEKDSISLCTKPDLNVWFERCGFVEENFIRFDYKRKEIDPLVMSEQAILDAGPLRGELRLEGISTDEIQVLQENKIGDPSFEELGKKILGILVPPLSNFLDVLRLNYGQFWLRRLFPWDSRVKSLGLYCAGLGMRWSLDGKDWKPLLPTEKVVLLSAEMTTDFAQYLTQADWKSLKALVPSGYEPSMAVEILSRTHALLDQKNFKFALVEAVTALEITLDAIAEEKFKTIGKMYGFWNRPANLQQKLFLMAGSNEVETSDLEVMQLLIKNRNEVVHEGWEPTSDESQEIGTQIHSFLAIASKLLSELALKFPEANHANARLSEEKLLLQIRRTIPEAIHFPNCFEFLFRNCVKCDFQSRNGFH